MGDVHQKDEDLRDKGYSGILEWGVTERSRLGASVMKSEITSETLDIMAVHDRIGFGKGHSVMFEAGQIKRTPQTGDGSTSRYGFLQTHLMWFRGMWVQTTLHYYRRDTSEDDETITVGQGLQWFPRQKMEFRLDVLNRRNFSETTASKDTWQVLGQVHVWL